MSKPTTYSTFPVGQHTPMPSPPNHIKAYKTLHYLFSCLCCCCCCEAETTQMAERSVSVYQTETDENVEEDSSEMRLTHAIWQINRTAGLNVEQDSAFTHLGDPEYMLRCSVIGPQYQRIGIIRTKDERGRLKNVDLLAQEIQAKVVCYLQAKQDPKNYILTEDGCAIDRREVKDLTVFEGNLAYKDAKGTIHCVKFKNQLLKVNKLLTHTFLKATLKDQIVEMSDDYDKVRPDRKERAGFFFSVNQESPKFMQLYRTRAEALK